MDFTQIKSLHTCLFLYIDKCTHRHDTRERDICFFSFSFMSMKWTKDHHCAQKHAFDFEDRWSFSSSWCFFHVYKERETTYSSIFWGIPTSLSSILIIYSIDFFIPRAKIIFRKKLPIWVHIRYDDGDESWHKNKESQIWFIAVWRGSVLSAQWPLKGYP